MAIDLNRNSASGILPPELSQTIWQDVQAASIVQSLAPGMALPGGGVDIPIITGDPEAEWVNETDAKPVSSAKFDKKNIKGYTLAVIVPFSNQFRRDLPALYEAIAARLPGVLAKKFDRTALGFEPSPGSGFDTLASAPTVELNGTVKKYLSALATVGSVPDADITAWALGPTGEIDALGTADASNRPLLVTNYANEGEVGRIFARPTTRSSNVVDAKTNTVGIAGDWGSVTWGIVEDIRISISDQATLTDKSGTVLNLWQRNMFALRAEIEAGFAVRDPKRFVKLTKKPVAETA
ncbi:phage major capsid protein [Corynebacterium pyruviciproducens]